MLKIITQNLNYYVTKHGPWEVRKKLILEVLNEVNPDVVVLQAVARHPDLYKGKDQAFQLCEALNGFQSHFFEEAQTAADQLTQGSAVISKLPIQEKSSIRLSLKPGLDDTNKRVLLRTTFESRNGKIDVYNAHFSWVGEQAATNMEEAVHLMKKGSTNAVLAGDLNTPPGTAFQPFLEAGYTDAWQKLHGAEGGYTFESDHPSIRIDYFWLSPSFADRVSGVSVLYPPAGSDARLSDHHGLLLELKEKG
jgi:endonuclease/exonuclease/phosphatase family metal-dependent hydrolase